MPTIANANGDLISRQQAIDAFGLSERTRKYGGDHSGYDTRMLYEIQDTLESLPSAQPEKMCVNLDIQKIATHKSDFSDLDELPSAQPEIIRCKDCKYGSPNGVYGCRLERYNFNDESVRMYGEDYCSRAERKE